MQVAGYKMPDQNTATDFLEKILSRKCKIHRKFSCQYLHLKPSQFSPRLCFQCIEERNISFNEAISIRLLLLATSNTTFFNAYPKFSDSSITQKIGDLKGSEDKISADLSSFFDSLHSAVSQAIEKAKNASKQKLATLSNSYQDVFNSLSSISKIQQFQEIVKNTNDNEEKLKEFIQEQYSSMNNYTEMISNNLLEYQRIQQSFYLTDANNKLSDIIRLIEGITLFPTIANNQQQSQQPQQQQQNLFQQPVQRQQLPVFLPPQQQLQQKEKQQQKPQQQLRESQQQKQQNQPSSLEYVYDYCKSLYKQCQEKWKNDDDYYIKYDYFDFDDFLYFNDKDDFDNYKDYYDYKDHKHYDSYKRWQALSEQKRQEIQSFLKRELNITD